MVRVAFASRISTCTSGSIKMAPTSRVAPLSVIHRPSTWRISTVSDAPGIATRMWVAEAERTTASPSRPPWYIKRVCINHLVYLSQSVLQVTWKYQPRFGYGSLELELGTFRNLIFYVYGNIGTYRLRASLDRGPGSLRRHHVDP